MANYLVNDHEFAQLYLSPAATTTSLVESFGTFDHATSRRHHDNGILGPGRTFSTVYTLLNFVTKNWQQRWVTTDVTDETVLEALSRRPFFLLVSIEAPVILRWKRFKDR